VNLSVALPTATAAVTFSLRNSPADRAERRLFARRPRRTLIDEVLPAAIVNRREPSVTLDA